MWKVLIVDDDLLIRKSVGLALDWEKLNCRIVATAIDAPDALQKIARYQPDLVLFTDAGMPRLSSELMRRAADEFPGVTVSTVDSYEEEQVRRVLERVSRRSVLAMMKQPSEMLCDEVYNGIRDMADEVMVKVDIADVEGVEKKVAEMFDQIEAQRVENMLFIASVCADMLIRGVNLVKQTVPDLDHLQIHAMLELLSGVQNVNEMRKMMLRYMRGMAGMILESGSEISRIVRRACQMIREEFRENITVSQIARRMHISVNYLQSQFKRDTGTTIRRYLTDVRIENAKRLLRQTNDKVSDICIQVGYKDADYFASIFSKAVGITPDKYRKSGMLRGEN